MLIENHFGRFKFESGSTVTILTTACGYHGRKIFTGIFTGVVLDENECNFDRTKHISVYASGEFYDEYHEPDKDEKHDEFHNPGKDKKHDMGNKPHQDEECCECHEQDKDNKPHKDEASCECHEHGKCYELQKDEESCDCHEHDKGNKPHKDEESCKWDKHNKEKQYEEWHKKQHEEWHKHDKAKQHEESHKHDKGKDYYGQEHHEKMKKEEESVVLKLTFPSFPFRPGQIVHINAEQIVAVSATGKN